MSRREVLALIPARGGSKSVPRKNVLPIGGKPLIVHSIEHALTCTLVTRTIVSTDDDEIAGIATRHGAEVPFRRPAEYATDTATDLDVFVHAPPEAAPGGVLPISVQAVGFATVVAPAPLAQAAVEALGALAQLRAAVSRSDRRSFVLTETAVLLKRTALAAYPRAQVASLSGQAWMDFLRQSLGRRSVALPST